MVLSGKESGDEGGKKLTIDVTVSCLAIKIVSISAAIRLIQEKPFHVELP